MVGILNLLQKKTDAMWCDNDIGFAKGIARDKRIYTNNCYYNKINYSGLVRWLSK